MASFRYPASSLDDPDFLLDMLGSFWSGTYQGNDLVQVTMAARARLEAQSHLDLMDLIASMSRFETPVFHRENWHFLVFLESEVNQSLEQFSHDTVHTYEVATGLRHGVPLSGSFYSVAAPEGLKEVPVILNRITNPSLTLTNDVDFWVDGGRIYFKDNPFKSDLVSIQEVFQDGQVVDRQAGLWLYHGLYDWQIVYEQFGYALKLRMQSSEGYKELLNAIFDATVRGSTNNDFHQAWSVITGVPLARGHETVEYIMSDVRSLCIITDQSAYKFKLGSVPLVEVGDVVEKGDPLVDTLQFVEFGRGEAEPDVLDGLVLGPGLLANGYFSDLDFMNEDVPLEVATEDGYTRVSFQLGGYPGDIEKFWDDVHAEGIRRGKTLAHMLDKRASPVGEPTAASLPATINPFKFLCENVLRYNAFVVRIRASLLGNAALGMWAASHLRRIVPSQTAMIVVVLLEHADEPIIMNGPGDETKPGYEEQVSGFPCMVVAETIDGPTMILERVRAYQVKGKCE